MEDNSLIKVALLSLVYLEPLIIAVRPLLYSTSNTPTNNPPEDDRIQQYSFSCIPSRRGFTVLPNISTALTDNMDPPPRVPNTIEESPGTKRRRRAEVSPSPSPWKGYEPIEESPGTKRRRAEEYRRVPHRARGGSNPWAPGKERQQLAEATRRATHRLIQAFNTESPGIERQRAKFSGSVSQSSKPADEGAERRLSSVQGESPWGYTTPIREDDSSPGSEAPEFLADAFHGLGMNTVPNLRTLQARESTFDVNKMTDGARAFCTFLWTIGYYAVKHAGAAGLPNASDAELTPKADAIFLRNSVHTWNRLPSVLWDAAGAVFAEAGRLVKEATQLVVECHKMNQAHVRPGDLQSVQAAVDCDALPGTPEYLELCNRTLASLTAYSQARDNAHATYKRALDDADHGLKWIFDRERLRIRGAIQEMEGEIATAGNELPYWILAAAARRQALHRKGQLPPGWVFATKFGSGGFATPLLYVRQDNTGHIIDRLVIKDCDYSRSPDQDHHWPYDRVTRKLIPPEAKFMYDLQATVAGGTTAQIRGWRVNYTKKIYRILIEYCPHGDLRLLVQLTEQNGDNQVYAQKGGNRVPEPFIWWTLECLAQAAEMMEKGGRTHQPEWQSIIHSDIKTANIFLGMNNTGVFRGYPRPKLGDFGLAFYANPSRVNYGGGTRGCQPPEAYPDNRYLANIYPRGLTSKSNVWGIGLVLWCLMHNNHRYDPQGFGEGYPHLSWNPEVKEYYSEVLRAIVVTCLAVYQNNRPDAADLITMVHQWSHSTSRVDYAQGFRNLDSRDARWHLRKLRAMRDRWPKRSLLAGKTVQQPRQPPYRPPGPNSPKFDLDDERGAEMVEEEATSA